MKLEDKIKSKLDISDSELKKLRYELSGYSSKSEGISKAFLRIIKQSDGINPTYLWNNILKPAYTDTYSGNQQQSWRSASGTGFKKFVCLFYNNNLPPHLRLEYRTASELRDILRSVGISSSKPHSTVTLEVLYEKEWFLLGYFHIHTSLGSRMRQSKELSEQLMNSNVFSPFLTLDTQDDLGSNSIDRRNIPRTSIEKEGSFSNMYCMNSEIKTTSHESEKNIKKVNLYNKRDAFFRDITKCSKRVNLRELSDRMCVSQVT